MKYLKRYEDINKYKDGDIVVLNKEKLCRGYVGRITDFLLSISDIQRIYVYDYAKKENLGPENLSYYFKTDNRRLGEFAISEKQILRLANDEEIQEFKMRENINKFNV